MSFLFLKLFTKPQEMEIDWDCPCVKYLTEGPCGKIFKQSFECYTKSHSKPKGKECIDLFINLQTCLTKNASYYEKKKKNL
ncbi:hypothetical protein M0811_12546 [Anaeramoeba ignava]|uniref:Mitochondrial intermembrane space import and assembly protein 40 n=1 Tax=Anaeramoeba ignava TaxID=1746090 RepID=A0A9Q0LBG8_ANAIG|nr:hypothetical protein M0811_12546 [Anaeramoeba ignava]